MKGESTMIYEFINKKTKNKFLGCQILDDNMETILSFPNIWSDCNNNVFILMAEKNEPLIYMQTGWWVIWEEETHIGIYSTCSLFENFIPVELVQLDPVGLRKCGAFDDPKKGLTADLVRFSKEKHEKVISLFKVYHHSDGRIMIMTEPTKWGVKYDLCEISEGMEFGFRSHLGFWKIFN